MRINKPLLHPSDDAFVTCQNCGVSYWKCGWHTCPVKETAVKCPVCDGYGVVNAFNVPGSLKPCHGCYGKGWVKV